MAVEWVKADRYGRKVGKVMLEGLDCNLVQVERGLAWHSKTYQREQSQADHLGYAAADIIAARAASLGLWGDLEHLPAWNLGTRINHNRL